MTVYIPTLSRYDTLEKIIPAWLEQSMFVTLVVDPAEMKGHIRFHKGQGWDSMVQIASVPKNDMGIGYKRRYCVAHARRAGLDSIIMSDDDHKPRNGSDMYYLLEEAQRPGVLGIGATVPIYSRFTGGVIDKLSGPILWPGGAGFSVYALNVDTAIYCGSFDRRLHSYGEDAELRRQGLARGIPWRVHCDVGCAPVNKRNSPGGFMAKYHGNMPARVAGETECRAIIHKLWPEYTSEPGKLPRMSWQKMLTDYVPYWREQSALHGGSLPED